MLCKTAVNLNTIFLYFLLDSFVLACAIWIVAKYLRQASQLLLDKL